MPEERPAGPQDVAASYERHAAEFDAALLPPSEGEPGGEGAVAVAAAPARSMLQGLADVLLPHWRVP